MEFNRIFKMKKRIKQEVLKETRKWHLAIWDVIDEVTVLDEWFDTKKEAQTKLEEFNENNDLEWEIEIKPHITEEAIDLTIQKTISEILKLMKEIKGED